MWLSFRGNMAPDQTVSQKQGWGSISGTGMRTVPCVPMLTHVHRHWLKMRTHTVSGICVALCVVAKAMKQNHGRRNAHFAQKTLNPTTDTRAVKFQNRFGLFWQVNSFYHPSQCDLSCVEGSKMDCNENYIFPLETNTRQHADNSVVLWMVAASLIFLSQHKHRHTLFLITALCVNCLFLSVHIYIYSFSLFKGLS